MDLQVYFRVLWRFRLLVLAGLGLALLLAFVSTMRVEGGFPPSIEPRMPESWHSEATLLVTQEGFPWGRSVVPGVDEAVPGSGSRFADPDRFTELAVLYAELAGSDLVRRIAAENGLRGGAMTAEAVTSPKNSREALPLLRVSGVASSPAMAVDAAGHGVEALQEYVKRQQDAAQIPEEQRVVLTLIAQPSPAVLIADRPMTRPVAVFLAVMVMVIALALVLENLRPRIRPVMAEQVSAQPYEGTRHTA